MKVVLLALSLLFALPFPAAADEIEEGKKLYKFICADNCHQIPDPEMLNAKQWKLVINKMQKRMAHKGMEPINDTDANLIYLYLEKNARK
ncbi:MAG: hypothetical protein OEY64_05480 [Nitrospinota bacterium]|nr:hypothetical protein [Nitrospinota bacterium]